MYQGVAGIGGRHRGVVAEHGGIDLVGKAGARRDHRQDFSNGSLPGRNRHFDLERRCAEDRPLNPPWMCHRVGDPEQATEGVRHQHHRWAAVIASALHNQVDVVDQRRKTRGVAPGPAAAAVAAEVEGINQGAPLDEPFSEVLVTTAVLAQPVDHDEGPYPRDGRILPVLQVQVETVCRLQRLGRFVHCSRRRKPR